MAHTILRSFSPLSRLIVRNFSAATVYRETKQRVLDVDINYIETVGSSKNAHPIFLLPGAFGSIEMDFKPLLPYLNKEKYKWLSWDPPGYGKSRPPRREFLSKRYESVYVLDVDYTKELMNMFGYQRYTLLAWSGAGHTAIIIASEQPEKVSGLITWGSFGYAAKEAIPTVEVMKKLGLNSIPEGRRNQLLDMYGEDYLVEMWNGWCDEAVRLALFSDEYKKGGSFEDKIRNVKCHSLVIQGTKDAIISLTQAHHLADNLKNSKLHIMENGTHNLHLRQTKEFVHCIEDFVDKTVLEAMGSN